MTENVEEPLRQGARALGIQLTEEAIARLLHLAERLLAWNRRINLTAITDPREIAEKHFLDSLLLLPAVAGRATLLDIGSGAGIPGMVLACARPELLVTCCDSVSKKIAFVKAISAELKLDLRALSVRATGDPARDHLPSCDAVVSRAVADPAAWVPLGAPYVAPGGALLAMLGREADDAWLAELGVASGLTLASVTRHQLPLTHADRAIATWLRPPRSR